MTQTPSRDQQNGMQIDKNKLLESLKKESEFCIKEKFNEKNTRFHLGRETVLTDIIKQIESGRFDILSTLYPDTPAQPPAPTPEITARSIDDWHEDYGDVLWWTFPIQEPPYCGSPLDSNWPDYHTHWTPLVIPAAPAPKEENNE